jgi:hypothetical protein
MVFDSNAVDDSKVWMKRTDTGAKLGPRTSHVMRWRMIWNLKMQDLNCSPHSNDYRTHELGLNRKILLLQSPSGSWRRFETSVKDFPFIPISRTDPVIHNQVAPRLKVPT